MSNSSWNRGLVIGLAIGVGMPAGLAAGDTIKVKNTSGGVRTLSDLYAFSESNNKGTKTELLKKGDATDDINMAAGAIKNITAPRGTDSFTISWMVNGVEVEADFPDRSGVDVELAMFFNPGGLQDGMAVAFDGALGQVPTEGFTGEVIEGLLDGHPEYSWISFYETSSSNGFIERDELGVPISPSFNGVVEVAFNYEVLSPAPGSMALLALGGLVAARRRR